MTLKNLTTLIILSLFVTGCASIKENRSACIAAGWVIGGVGVGVAEDDAAIAGAAAGALVGWLVCPGDSDSDGDGVKDKVDTCPGTPLGTPVSSNGCQLDADNDGVADHVDNCPGTKAGVSVDRNGCALDSDGDKVPDHMDKCPNSRKGEKVDKRGCALDTDGDGVPDTRDQCPKTAKGKAVDKKGCHITIRLTGLNFATDSYVISDEAKGLLATAVRTLKENKDLRVRIEGHTDSRGSEAYNLSLSGNRANAVREYLIAEGINGRRLESRGYGESSPVASNDNSEGRARNRRVDFAVID